MINIGGLPKVLAYIFMVVGSFACTGTMTVIIIGIQGFISDLIKGLKWKYKYKHRFDKPPLAKCYCKDCDFFGKNNDREDWNECLAHKGWRVAEEWFCWEATPCENDTEKE
jgi:hypothetical protein